MTFGRALEEKTYIRQSKIWLQAYTNNNPWGITDIFGWCSDFMINELATFRFKVSTRLKAVGFAPEGFHLGMTFKYCSNFRNDLFQESFFAASTASKKVFSAVV